jgi:hypothetical protein
MTGIFDFAQHFQTMRGGTDMTPVKTTHPLEFGDVAEISM